MSTFQQRLRKAMFMKGIRQAEIAERSGIDKSKISRYVGGKNMPSGDTLIKLAAALGVDAAWLSGEAPDVDPYELIPPPTNEVKILGSVAAGIPITAQEDVIGVVCSDIQKPGMFALKIKGDSMSPRIMDGDIVLVQSQKTAEDGDIVIAMIEGEATCKVFKKTHNGVTLIPFNGAYPPIFCAGEGDDFCILGKVVESHHRWE